MRLASLLAASLLSSLLASVPAAARAQGMDAPPGAVPGPIEGAPGTPGAAALPEVKKEKNGPYVGFSFGTGTGTIYSGSSSLSIDEALGYSGQSPTNMALMFRFGWGSGDFLFGGQFNWIRSWVDVSGVSAGLDFRGFDLTATLWSQEMGLYTRVGVGPASFNSFVDSNTSKSYSGVELMLGVGATLGGLGVGVDLIRQNYTASETGFDYVQYALVTLSLDLY
jgi:hypothetical protein